MTLPAESPADGAAQWLRVTLDPEAQRLLARLPELLPAGSKPAVLVTVLATEGSAPRGPGARILCRDAKLLAGTIGGGHLEEQALADACWTSREQEGDVDGPQPTATEIAEESGPDGTARRLCRYALGPKLAQCCGGVVWLHYQEVSSQRAVALAQELAAAEQAGTELLTRFGDRVLAEKPAAVTTVLLFGAGHVAAALARVLQPLPWRVLVVDARPEWADPVRFPRQTEVLCTEPLRLLAAWGWLGPQAQASQAAMKLAPQLLAAQGRALPPPPPLHAAHAAVMTFDHAQDRDIVEALLCAPTRTAQPNARLAFVGLIGSATKIATTRQRLRQRGVTELQLADLTAPIGLQVDGRPLGGNLPGEIAIATAAQLLALQPRRTAAASRG